MPADRKDSDEAAAAGRKARRVDLKKGAATSPAAPRPEKKTSRPAAPDDTSPRPEAAAPEDRPADAPPFPVVGIGASAGGLEALETFFKAMPKTPGMAFAVVTHTDPRQTSLLPDIMERQTKIRVVRVEDGTPLEPDILFLPPSDRDLLLEGETFRLRPRPGRSELHMPVDRFLRSLAESRGPRAACVILSGSGTDGTYGVRAVKERSGLAVVQSPQSAQHRGMPESAIDTGLVDIVAAPEEMPGRINDYFTQTAAFPAGEEDTPAKIPEPIEPILSFIARRTRHDFSLYKAGTLQRRIGRRIAVTRSRDARGYLERLRQDRQEAELLFQDLLVGVTSFFRDPETFAFFQDKILPDLTARPEAGDNLRVWVPGCSTGEEVYSLAMVLTEHLERHDHQRELQIFGTDIDPRAIETARAGEYPKNIAADVSPERLARFFTESRRGYRIRRQLREPLVFAEQNVLRDPPFSNLDVVVCRNLLIYLNNKAQERLIPLFHHVLRRGGVLFLGKSESIGRAAHLFRASSKKFSIFRKSDTAGEIEVYFPTGRIDPALLRDDAQKGNHEKAPPAGDADLGRAVDRILMQAFGPACAVVNANGDLVFTRGRSGQFLELAQGKPNLNIADMAREGLRFPLIATMRRARETGGWVEQKGLRVKTNGGYQESTLKVRLLDEPPLQDHLLVVMEAVGTENDGDAAAQEGWGGNDDADQQIAALEKELQRLRMEYRSAREELETSNEELRSSNEELQSSNEELQSTNEELESSREELHSLNEELNTVNDELSEKMDQLHASYQAVTDTLDSTGIAIVFLDRELRVSRFTAAASTIIKLIDSDVGRPLEHIADNLENGHLVQRAARVLDTLEPTETEIRTRDGRWFRMNLLVHRLSNYRIEGVVATFVNIDAQKAAQEEAAARGRRLADSIVATVRESLLVLSEDLRVLSANNRFYRVFRTDPAATEGRLLYELGHGQWDIPELRRLLETVAAERKTFEDYRVEHDFPAIGKKAMLLNARHLQEQSEAENKILLAIEDITERGGDSSAA